MADDRYRKDHPPHSRPEDRQSQHHPQAHYPPSVETTPRPSDGQRVSMAASVTLPPMQDHRAGGYGPPPHPQGYSYPPDPRYASPNATNGYPPPTGQSGYLPPPQQPSDPRAPGYRPPEHHYSSRPPPSYSHDPHYPPPQEYYYRGQGPPPPPGHYPPYGAAGHHYPPEYAQAQPPPMAQAAPRQRTSIACKYCRKRKIRCSGYQSAPGGKCQNCARMNQECVFQPVSSSSSTAFIPVSAVPGGVPPGTPLFGAYGQPLPQPHHYQPGAAQQPPPPPPPGYPHPPPPNQQPSHHPSQQGPPAQSPAESSYSYTSGRAEEGSQTSRRRRRSSASQEEGDQFRLPPPRPNAPEEEPRRRSPAEHSNTSSPGVGSFPPFARNSPRNHLPQLTLTTGSNSGPATNPGNGSNHLSPMQGTSTIQNGSSGSSTPSHSQNASQGAGAQSARRTPPAGQKSSVMSLSNLVEKNDIDKGMIDRLNRSRDPKPPQYGASK